MQSKIKMIQGIGQGVTVRRWIDKLLRENPQIERKKIKIRKSFEYLLDSSPYNVGHNKQWILMLNRDIKELDLMLKKMVNKSYKSEGYRCRIK